ncbi:MAG: hypothetical protein LBE12_19360 [Planctomycetaceae bacterium]|jgi:hypothetical protein|nr:hypothetical protein [Planctomycetaceae bacterium]
MSTFVIITADILSSLFLLLLLWYVAIKPFIEEYLRLQIDRLEALLIADTKQYPCLKPHSRKLRALFRLIGNRPHLCSITFLLSGAKESLTKKTADKITKHIEDILNAINQYEKEQGNTVRPNKMVQIFLTMLACQNPLFYWFIKILMFTLRINLQRILAYFYKYFIDLKIPRLVEQKNQTYPAFSLK